MWTGKNGATFLGTFANVESDGKILFLLSNGKVTRVSGENLSETDLELIRKHRSKPAGSGAESEEFAKFLPDPDLSRANIPVINQKDYGKGSDCVPSAFCTFLLWWDQNNHIPINKRGDFARKAQYIHTRTGRYFATRNNRGTYSEDMRKGIAKYFTKDLEDIAAHRMTTVFDCDPEVLARYTQGTLATLLSISIFTDGRYDSGHMVALVDADPDGRIVLNTWGKQIKGKLEYVGEAEFYQQVGYRSNSGKASHYRIIFTSPDALPVWMNDQETTFEIDPSRSDFLTVIAPYRFAREGVKARPPEDPRFALTEGKQAPLVQ